MNLDELKRLAEEASETDWKWEKLKADPDDGYVYVPPGSYLGSTMISLADTYEGSGKDCLYVQSMNPATALKLLAVAEAAETADVFFRMYSSCNEPAQDDMAEEKNATLDALRTALEELK